MYDVFNIYHTSKACRYPEDLREVLRLSKQAGRKSFEKGVGIEHDFTSGLDLPHMVT